MSLPTVCWRKRRFASLGTPLTNRAFSFNPGKNFVNKRRTIGSAFEQSPAERLGRWVGNNSLPLLVAVAVALAFWILVNLGVDLLNFIESGGMGYGEKQYSHDDPVPMWTKLIGSPLLAILVAASRTK